DVAFLAGVEAEKNLAVRRRRHPRCILREKFHPALLNSKNRESVDAFRDSINFRFVLGTSLNQDCAQPGHDAFVQSRHGRWQAAPRSTRMGLAISSRESFENRAGRRQAYG